MQENSLAKNSFFFVCYKLLNAVFPFVMVSYASHILLASGMGKVSSAQNIVQYFVLAASLGIPSYGTREIARCRESLRDTNKLFSELFTINFISTCSFILIYYFMIMHVDFFSTELKLYVLLGLTIVTNFFNVDWFYEGHEEYAYIAKRSFIIKLVSLGMLFFLVKTADDYVKYVVVHIFGTAGNHILNCIRLKKYNIKYSIKHIKITRHLQPILVMLCTTIAIELYTLLDTTMMTFLCSSENIAYYTNSIKVVRMVITLVTALGGVLLPRLSHYSSKGMYQECKQIVDKIFNVLFWLLIPCGVGIFMIADSLVLVFFGSSFVAATNTLKIASLLIYALGFSNLFGTQILVTFGGEKKLLMATVVGAATNVALNLFLIPLWQHNGAVIASIVSELFVTIITFIFANKYLKIQINIWAITKTLVACLGMSVVLFAMQKIICTPWLYLIIAVLVGVIVYFVLNVVLKNEIALEFKRFIQEKIKRR